MSNHQTLPNSVCLTPDFVLGFEGAPSNPDLLASSSYDLAMFFEQQAVVCIINGIKSINIYMHDNALMGNPSTSPVVSAAVARVASLAGKTVTALTLQANGGYRLDTSDGPFYFGHI